MKAAWMSAMLLATGVALAAPDCEGPHARTLHGLPAAMVSLDARAVWLDARHLRWPGAREGARFRLVHSARGQVLAVAGQPVSGADGAIPLTTRTTPLPPALAGRFQWVQAGPVLAVPAGVPMRTLHRSQLVLVQEDGQGRVEQATAVQVAGALDDLFADAERVADLGAVPTQRQTTFKLWAPTAQAVSLCLHARGSATPARVLPLRADARTGMWQARVPRDLQHHTYTYLVDVFVRGHGVVRNRVTDPYSLSLTANSQRSWVGRLDAPELQPPGWLGTPRPPRALANTDLVIYELHVRDFSLGDPLVPAADRGRYLGFTHPASHGMRHLRLLADAGLTDVHLLPVFDLATVPERGCTSPDPAALAGLPPAGEEQQALVKSGAKTDCFNWGYDPLHFTAPEGSFASDAEDPAVRIVEFRRMVMALHAAGLRVGMDVVYNHTSASGQHAQSVLDRIVPGYYQRYDATGKVATSTCCDNTATENRMMAKLMIDSAVVWVRDHRIDSFRFDLMGHQPREAMLRLQAAVNRAAGRHIHLIGEGWNFGEIANGSRFVQASQLSLNGSGIGAFSDRGRDAARGGGCCDNAEQTATRKGWLNGNADAPNAKQQADLVRLGLAGTLRDYRFTTHEGRTQRGAEIDYAGQPAGYASEPGEVVNYVENHDNQTLFDLHTLKLPRDTSREDRARAQVLGLALTAFSQGVAYFHAGVELLRSKNGDRNSYDSGDWFNRLDYTLQDNAWGSGLPPKQDSGDFWPLLRPLLADPGIKPLPEHIRFTRDAMADLLKLRASSGAFRLRSAAEVQRRLTLLNTGSQQIASLMLGHLDARGLDGGGGIAELLYAINADAAPATITLPTLQGRGFVLHPVHRAAGAADPRPARDARWDATTGTLTVPPRTALVFVLN
jgi:pullulanase